MINKKLGIVLDFIDMKSVAGYFFFMYLVIILLVLDIFTKVHLNWFKQFFHLVSCCSFFLLSAKDHNDSQVQLDLFFVAH